MWSMKAVMREPMAVTRIRYQLSGRALTQALARISSCRPVRWTSSTRPGAMPGPATCQRRIQQCSGSAAANTSPIQALWVLQETASE